MHNNHFDINYILNLIDCNDTSTAEKILKQKLKKEPNNIPAVYLLGITLERQGNYQDAIKFLYRATILKPESFDFHNALAKAYNSAGRFEQAITSLKAAILIDPVAYEARLNLANIYKEIGKIDEAAIAYKATININPVFLPTYMYYTEMLLEKSSATEALEVLKFAETKISGSIDIHVYKAKAYEILGFLESALEELNKAIRINSQDTSIYFFKAELLNQIMEYEEAIKCYDLAIAINNFEAESYLGKANILRNLRRWEEALICYNQCIILNPENEEALAARGSLFYEIGYFEDSLNDFEKARIISKDGYYLIETTCFIRQKICDWTNLESDYKKIVEKILLGSSLVDSFPILSLSNSERINTKATLCYINTLNIDISKDSHFNNVPLKRKIRLGYFSSDFYDHATSHLISNIIEEHDREKFEILGFSFGLDTGDNYRKRIFSGFDHCFDVKSLRSEEISNLSKDNQIDIAIDLKGLTKGHRLGIFASRAAPIQVNFLGYPGSLGASFYDYIIADKIVIPEQNISCFSEKIIFLPDSYQPNDPTKNISEEKLLRRDYNLPDNTFVFCCFNNGYKILPETFNIWLDILKEATNSVIWLLEDNEKATSNLKNYCVSNGVDENRIIFSKRQNLKTHLARHKLADLFLDTLPYCAHTTASDALFSGLPILTRIGETFAGRVTSSLLTACDLHELITNNQQEYKAKALNLYRNPAEILFLKEKIRTKTSTGALFNAKKYCIKLEESFAIAQERKLKGDPLCHIYID